MDEELKQEVESLIFRIQLGGERGRKLMLRTFLRALTNGSPEAGMWILRAALGGMPKEDREHVVAIIDEVTKALAYDDE
jgi:hypothetical protein